MTGDLVILAALSLGAAVIHLAAWPVHYVELGDLGAGFLVAAAFQGAWARSALWNPSNRLIWLGIIGNSAIIVAWAWSRTIGLPVGLEAGIPESVGLPDGVSTLFELLIVGGLVARLCGAQANLVGPIATLRRSLLTKAHVPALGLILLTTAFATFDIVAGHEHGHSDDAPTSRSDAPHTSLDHQP